MLETAAAADVKLSLESEIKDDDDWTKGDVEIISSNRVRFRVRSEYLVAGSTVMRNMLRLDKDVTRPELELYGDFEDGRTIKQVLDLMTGRSTFERPYSESHLEDFIKLYSFIHKWECYQVHYTLRLFLQATMTGDRSDPDDAESIFILGALDNDVELCEQAIRFSGKAGQLDNPDHEYTSYDAHDRSAGRRTDPANWSRSHFTLCDFTFMWALKRAFDISKGDPNRTASMFTELIQEC